MTTTGKRRRSTGHGRSPNERLADKEAWLRVASRKSESPTDVGQPGSRTAIRNTRSGIGLGRGKVARANDGHRHFLDADRS